MIGVPPGGHVLGGAEWRCPDHLQMGRRVTAEADKVLGLRAAIARHVRVSRLLAAASILIAVLCVPSGQAPRTLDWRLAAAARSASFDLWSWEIKTLISRVQQSIFDRPSALDGPDLVREYVRLSAEAAQARRERNEQWAREVVMGSTGELSGKQDALDALEREVADLRPSVEETLSKEIEAELERQRVRSGLVRWDHLAGFPFLRPEIVPGVFFQLGPLPELLVVAPRDRIELIGSVLVQPDLTPHQIDTLERQADSLNVSSVVTGLGGLAAYPSIVPDETSIRDLLITVSHEWTHHYLALRPLGMAYFQSYQMREINETVADMVGHEVGMAVYERLYAPRAPAPPRSTPPANVSSSRPDFVTLMRRIRVTVEGYLARHDVAGADAYMARAQQDLAQQGYYVRRLNTAYLAFFGSYAATANPYEAKLRRLRAESGSLAAFLDRVSQVRTPADLDRELETSTRLP